MTPREVILQIARRLREAGVPDATTDSALMLSALLRKAPLPLRMDMDSEVGREDLERLEAMISRRMNREPLQYILGEAPFCGRMFTIGSGALIPRPETEELCRWVLEEIEAKAAPAVLDLCSGSGCIGLTIGAERADARVALADLSPEALERSRKNAEILGIEARLIRSDLFAALKGERFDLIISNPPYIESEACGALQEEVLHEPRMALDGGPDGLDFYRRIAAEGQEHLKEDGCLMMEMGDGEAEAVRRLLEEAGWEKTEVRRDLAGKERMIRAKPGRGAAERGAPISTSD